MRMPDTMSFVEGAAFTIGAQTSYGMIRRLAPKVGSTALVTAGRSNTSLFLINALRARGVRVFALSSSRQHFERLRSLGVEEVFNPGMLTKKFAGKEPIVAVARKLGGFDHVFDPFFDIYMSRVLVLLAFGGSYISCGLYNQYQEAIGLEMPHVMSDYKEAILCALKNNLRIQGNRLGVKGDLRKALSDFEAGSLPLVIDSNYTGDEVGDFLLRTYVSADRFGKVIYSYS